MRFTLGRVVHFYYLFILLAVTSFYIFGVKHYWDVGLLNTDYVSSLYDGTSKVKAVKERNDIEELKKLVDGDQVKDANRVFLRLEADIKDLKNIKSIDEKSELNNQIKKTKEALASLQTGTELTAILNNISGKITTFESFVTEKHWPTLMKMAINLRIKTSPSRLMSNGLYNYERTQNLAITLNNDLEAMSNFTQTAKLADDIRIAIINRIKTIRAEVSNLDHYVADHKNFSRIYKDFHTSYITWFKLVEPEIALKKIQFEKSSQGIWYGLVGGIAVLLASIVMGVMIYNYSVGKGSKATEKLILETIKDGLIPTESKTIGNFSNSFNTEFDKYREYTHKRMAFGSIFQETMPFASILLDSNLNLIWGNSHFYEQWKLESFKDESDSLSWDFLQRFTDLSNNSIMLNALRMNHPGVHKMQVKTNAMTSALPYEMHISPVDFASQKRIMIIFYPLKELETQLEAERCAILNPLAETIKAQLNGTLLPESKLALRTKLDQVGALELYRVLFEYIGTAETKRDELTLQIDRLENELNQKENLISDFRKLLVNSFETQRNSVQHYNNFKASVTSVLDSRDQYEEQLGFIGTSSRELFKDQSKIFNMALTAERSVDNYAKSIKNITGLKEEFKDLKKSTEDFKTRIVQVLDQLLIFKNHDRDEDVVRIDQFLGNIKLELKGFEKILYNFNQVTTQMDITITKLDMMLESRESVDFESIQNRMEAIKNNLENAQYSTSKITQSAHNKDEVMIKSLKALVVNLKSEMKRIDEMCKIAGLTPQHLDVISPNLEIQV
jgi:hypothetical protein